MRRKTFQGFGWLSAVFCAGAVASAAGSYDTTPFVGMWTTRAESIHSNCGKDTVDDLLGTSITWSAGASGHIQAELIGKCVLDAKVNGKTATASDQTCADNGLTYVVGGTFILQADGTARLNEHVKVTGRGVNCTGTVNGPFQKQ